MTLFTAPKFWYKRNAISTCLMPVSYLYYQLSKFYQSLRNIFFSPSLNTARLIVVGNIVAGGSGKTPVVQALGKHCQQQGYNVNFVSRGFGRSSCWLDYKNSRSAPILVDLNVHDARKVGDEPLVLARTAPTWVSNNRYHSIISAEQNGASVIISDDGYQTINIPSAQKILVLSLSQGVGNGRLLPAGPLRQTIADALRQADVIWINDDSGLTASMPSQQWEGYIKQELQPQRLPDVDKWIKNNPHLPVVYSRYEVSQNSIEELLKAPKVIAFAGIGYPVKFKSMLENLGVKIAEFYSFADHQLYTAGDLEPVLLAADRGEARGIIVTTRKDWVRLPPSLKPQVKVIDIELAVSNFAAAFF